MQARGGQATVYLGQEHLGDFEYGLSSKGLWRVNQLVLHADRARLQAAPGQKAYLRWHSCVGSRSCEAPEPPDSSLAGRHVEDANLVGADVDRSGNGTLDCPLGLGTAQECCGVVYAKVNLALDEPPPHGPITVCEGVNCIGRCGGRSGCGGNGRGATYGRCCCGDCGGGTARRHGARSGARCAADVPDRSAVGQCWHPFARTAKATSDNLKKQEALVDLSVRGSDHNRVLHVLASICKTSDIGRECGAVRLIGERASEHPDGDRCHCHCCSGV
mmetsp:Transcript_24479/g.51968  ORF Transcript_24479/g.51968 Transcript_24479/m.51968 type:complete len:274 (-) Transcript_24479:685-1506(-)